MENALDFRDEQEKVEPSPLMEAGLEEPQQDTKIEDTLAQSVTPTSTPEQAAQVVGQFSPEQQQQSLMWLNSHRGALFASQVASILDGTGSVIDKQLESLGASAGQAAGQAASGFQFGIAEQTAADQQKDKKYAGKETLATYTDPLMGQFQVLFDVDQGVSASLMDGVVTVFAKSGLTLRTPQGLPDVTIKLVRVDLKTGAASIVSDPKIGAIEERLITEGLRSSLLAGVGKMDSQADLATTLGLEVNKEGKIPLYESVWADVYLDASAAITTTMSDSKVTLHFSEPIFCDILGPVNLHIMAIAYDFRTASIDLIPPATGGAVGVVLEEYASQLGEGFANDFIRSKMPAAMKVAGYSPKKDPKLTENFNALLTNLGVSKGDKSEVDKARAAEEVKEARGAAPAADAGSGGSGAEGPQCAPLEGDFVPLYTVSTASGTIALAVDKGDAFDVSKSATEIRLGASRGIYVVAPGAPYLSELRIFDVRYGLADGKIQISASEEVGELVTEVLESLIRTQVLPRMPGEVLSKLGVGKDPSQMEESGDEEVLYAVEAPGLGQVQVMADASDTVKISRGETRLEIASAKGVRLRVLGADWIPDLVIGLLAYDTETGQVAIEPPSGGERLDAGPLTEKIVEAIMRTQLLPLLPGEVRDSAGLESSKDPTAVPEAQGNVIVSDTWGPLGQVDVSLAPGDTIGFKNGPEGAVATISQGLMVRAPSLGFVVRIFELGYDPVTKKVTTRSEPKLGSYEEALIGGALGEFVMPQLQAWIATHDEDLTDKLTVLYRSEIEGFGQYKICVEAGDSVQLQQDDASLTLSSSKGIFWMSEGGDIQKVLPSNRITQIRLDLNTGEMTINARSGVGLLGERIATRFLQFMALPQIDPALREKLFGGKDPLQKEEAKVPGALGNVLWEGDLGGLGPIDVSIKDGDTLGVAQGPEGIKINVGGGVRVRLPKMGLTARIFELGYDPQTGKLTAKSDPPMGPYEQEIVVGALEAYVMPSIQDFMSRQDANPKDSTRVLFKADLGGQGSVRICVEQSDTLQIDQDAESISVSAAQGIFWLAEGELSRTLPANRIRRVSMSLKTGEVEIDADQDIGPLGEHVATRVIQSAVLPRIDARTRDMLFGGQDPLQQEKPALPKAGQVLYSGKVAGMDFDVSLAGGKFSIDALPGGQLAFGANSGGLMLRVPQMALAVTLFDIAYDPKAATLTHLRTHPPVGAGELELLQAAIRQFAQPAIAEYVKPEKGDGAKGLRTVAAFGGVSLKVPVEGSVSVNHGDRFTEVRSEAGMVIESGLLSEAPPRLRSVRYEHGTGRISLDLVNTVDNTVYKDQTEVSGFTQDVISGLVRRLVDPHLTPEMRAMGLAGAEAQPETSARPRQGETTWMDITSEAVGRVLLFTQKDDAISLVAGSEEFNLTSKGGVRLVLPDLGVSQTFSSLRYHLGTDDVQLTGMGRLEHALMRNVARAMVGPLLAQQGVDLKDPKGMGQQLREQQEETKKGELLIKTDGAELYVPSNCVMTATLTGAGLRVGFEPKIWIDGPSFGNFYLDKIKYDFATARTEVDIDGSNILSAIFEGVGEDKATAPLAELLKQKMPAAMRAPGYNLFADPNKSVNLAQLFKNFNQPAPETEADKGKKKK